MAAVHASPDMKTQIDSENPKGRIRAIILDMDGVVIDSEPLHCETEKRLFAEYGIVIEPNDWPQFKGLTPGAVFEFVRVKYGFPEPFDVFHTKKDRYLAERYELELGLFPDFLPLVERFREGHLFALTTSTHRTLTDLVLTKFGLRDIFQVVVTSDDVARGKPDPEPYLRTIKALQVQPSECVVIEDSIHGIRSARSAGAWCVAVATSFPREALGLADLVVDNLASITAGALSSLR